MPTVASRSHGVQLLGDRKEASPLMLLGQKFLGASFCLRGPNNPRGRFSLSLELIYQILEKHPQEPCTDPQVIKHQNVT